ncbi:phytoene/squalene synthase family protein [Zobellia galactanivorans]|uniref:phytoene/squalene synthase family protein n=1 Tax=Zobellia galactanivorans (strain DSM 12802 / CCUG 47099 / CIP 106680 / NCIMB 13871 / Dsij) TaxID=63186 RepID=UPI001C06AE9A|nr:phytoene/squalene synthase family protein [Zobellia galactanivorans]MBU3025113.1 phytoene/squalene synthase family protein [Zobellia galactanivorans]MDO6810532.1 phytoene/squalene synthase family protein [Zobellia galactanivorans]
MKALFDKVSYQCSKTVTESYSTSFTLATKMLSSSIRSDIYNIYGFVRFADEIVDSFDEYNKEKLFNQFEASMKDALEQRISLNPILNSFQHTYHKYEIPYELVAAFMKSMRMDLYKNVYRTEEEYREYIYGSADVVGLMCLKVFVKGDIDKYNSLKETAMALGSAFQKVNFLRDLKSDYEDLNRSYFPNTDLAMLDEASKTRIVNEIKADFQLAYKGILQLPNEAKFGVYTAYKYYYKLLKKLQRTPSLEIRKVRIRVPNYEKFGLLAKSYVNYKLNLV